MNDHGKIPRIDELGGLARLLIVRSHCIVS